MSRVWQALVQCLDGLLVNPAPSAWCLHTKHARYTSRSEEPGLVAAALLKSKDVHIGSNLCKISLVGSLGEGSWFRVLECTFAATNHILQSLLPACS